MIGIAIIGTGRWAPRLAEAAGPAGLRVVACYSRDETARGSFAERFACQSASSFNAAVEHPEVQGVLIVTPNDTHADQAIACANHGRHVFVEKPIADTIEAGERMRDACTEAGVTLMVGHAFRRLGAARRTKQLIDEGALGKPVLAEANMSLPGAFNAKAWRAYRARNPGGPLMQLGIHHVDTLQSWLGPIAEASGRFAHVHTDAEIDDVGVVNLRFASGALASVTGSYVSPKTCFLRLYGTEAVLDYTVDFDVWPDPRAVDGATTLTLNGEPIAFDKSDMLAEQLGEFARCINGETQPETGATEGLAALSAIRDALSSASAPP